MKKLAVIVPVYNEQENINHTFYALDNIRNELSKVSIDLHIIAINDGSNDDSLKELKKLNFIELINHPINLGLGAAVRSGLMYARNMEMDFVVKFDADQQHEAKDILSLIQPLIENQADIVYGNRFKLISYQMPLMRKIGNKVFSYLMKKLTGWPVIDSQPGILAVNRYYLEKFSLPGDYNYTQQLLLDAYYKNCRFKHVDVHFNKRMKGESFIGLKYPFKVIPQIIQIIIGIKPLKFFAPIGLFFLLMASVVSIYEIYLWSQGNQIKPIEHVNFVIGTGLFGLQTIFFGLMADLIIRTRK